MEAQPERVEVWFMLPLVVTVEDIEAPGAEERYAFARAPVRLGRSALNDLVLDRPFVSQWHAVIEFDADGTRFVDLGATNPSTRDGQPLPPHRPVELGDDATVVIGALRLTLRREPIRADFRAGAAIAQQSVTSTEEPPPATAVYEERRTKPVAAGQVPVPASPAAPAPPLRLPSSSPAPHHPSAPPSLAGVSPGRLLAQDAVTAIRSARTSHPRDATTVIADDRTLVTPMHPDEHGATTLGVSAPPSAGVSALQSLVQSQAASEALAPLYARYCDARAALVRAITDTLEATPPGGHAVLAALLEQDFPLLSELEEVRAKAASHGAKLGRTASSAPAAPPVIDHLRPLGEYLSAGTATVASAADREALVERMAQVLYAFATVFVALQQGHEEFAAILPVPLPREATTPLAHARDARAVLAHLFAPATPGEHPIDDLRRASAGFMVHQLRLLGGMRAGVRGLLSHLSPTAIARDAAAKPARRSPLEWLRAWLQGPSASLWEAYTRRHAELAEEGRELTELLFGPEFMRAYARHPGGPSANGSP